MTSVAVPADISTILTSLHADTTSHSDAVALLQQLHLLIVGQGIDAQSSNSSASQHRRTSDSQRSQLWQLLLHQAAPADTTATSLATNYINTLKQGRSLKYEKIRVDVARTYPKHADYYQHVQPAELIRLLNVFVDEHSQGNSDATPYRFTYTQGMNSLAAPLLYIMPELNAYYTFTDLILHHIPLYYQSSHIGVNAGCKLIDKVLQVVDSELSEHLTVQHSLQAYIYAFSAVSSLCASIPPLSELLLLWDFLFSTSPALCILCVVAQVTMLRDQLLQSTNPKAILDYRLWPALNAKLMIERAQQIIGQLSDELLSDVYLHASDVAVAEKYAERVMHSGIET